LVRPEAVGAFPLNAPNARTLFGGFTLLTPEFRIIRATKLLEGGDRVPDPLDRKLTVYEETFTFVHGVTRNLTLGLTVPVVEKELEFRTASGGKATVRSQGVGDITLVSAYRFLRLDAPRRTTQLSFLGALKLPSGSDSRTSSRFRLLDPTATSNRLPPDLQIGSGSVDGIIGLGGFQNFDRLSFYASAQYKANSEANDFRAGNTLFYDFTTDWVFLESRNLFLVLEFNGVYTARSEMSGEKLRNSGGNTLFISPGIVYLPIPQLILDTSVQIPIVQHVNGRQLAPDYTVLVGLRYLF